MTGPKRYRPGRGRQLSSHAPCLYPGCQEVIDVLPEGGGRPRNFCSDRCRANFHNIQRQLNARIATIRDDLQHAPEDLKADVERELALVVAHLNRFRPLQTWLTCVSASEAQG